MAFKLFGLLKVIVAIAFDMSTVMVDMLEKNNKLGNVGTSSY